MSVFLRTLLVASVASLLVVGCNEKSATPEATAPASVAAPEATPAPVAPAAESAASGGGYEPSAEERVPGITLDAAPADSAAPAAAPAAK